MKKRSTIVKKKEQDLYDYDEHLMKLSVELDRKKKELESQFQDKTGTKRRETAKLNWDFLRKAFKSKANYPGSNSAEFETQIRDLRRILSEKEEIIDHLSDKVNFIFYIKIN